MGWGRYARTADEAEFVIEALTGLDSFPSNIVIGNLMSAEIGGMESMLILIIISNLKKIVSI